MINWLKRHWKWVTPLAAAGIGVGAWLVFGYFGLHLIFIDDKVDEPPPLFASGAGASGLPSDFTSEDLAEQMNEAMAQDSIPAQVQAVDELPMDLTEQELEDLRSNPTGAGAEVVAPTDPAADTIPDAVTDTTNSSEPPTPPPLDLTTTVPPTTTTVPPTTTTVPEIRIAAEGDFISRSHPTRGVATVLTDGIQRFLRFEDFATDNGPDLNVYLSTAATDAPASQFDDDFIDLGDLKGNIGSQNYEIPAEVDLDVYSTVVIWCVRFSVIFGAAELT